MSQQDAQQNYNRSSTEMRTRLHNQLDHETIIKIRQQMGYVLKPKTIQVIFLIFLCSLVIKVESQSYTVAQEFHTNYFSDNDIVGTANPWTFSGANIPTHHYFTDCAGTRLMGGFQVLSGDNTNPAWLQKTWTDLPPHYEATISMKIYKIDSWNSDSFFVMVDGTSIEIFSWGTTTGTTDICGQANPFINTLNPQYNEFIQTYSQTIPHSSSSLSLKLISTLKSWTGSWGIRELTISLSRCHLSCLTCTGPTMCATCDTPNLLNLVGQFCECSSGRKLIQTGCPATRCVSCISATCHPGYYNFNLTSCASCSPACGTCTGPGSLSPDCASCNPQGYINPGTGVCTICYGSCASCTGILQNQCTSCQQGAFLNSNQCLSSCPSGFFASETSALCIACSSPCATCDGSTLNHCLSCLSGFYLYQTTCSSPCPLSMYGYNGLCVSSCPLGTYLDTTTIPRCLSCPAFCETCDLTGKCITCSLGAFFSPYDNLCHNPCPGSFYGDPLTFVCAACDPSCLTCYGPTSGQCSSCYPLTYLVYSSCYAICPTHTYSLTCLLCHQSCLNCTGPASNQCSSCPTLRMLHLNTSQCLASCLDGDIANNIDMTCLTCGAGMTGYFKQCVNCHASCKTCNGLWFDQCASCVQVAAHQPSLVFNYNKVLNVNSVTFAESMSMCIYEGTPIIYMPATQNSKTELHTALVYVIWCNIAITLVLEIIFQYKTNLLLFIETMQLLSYLYYFSAPLSESNQITLLFLFNAHPTALPHLYSFLPSLSTLANLAPHSGKILPKALLLGKTGIFVADSFYFQVFMLLLIMLFIILRIGRNGCKLYDKCNPYLLTYSFRLFFMELIFAVILYLSYVQLDTDSMKWSLALVIIDLAAIACSLFWKIRTDQEQSHTHFALFYFNELGPASSNGRYQQLTEEQQKQRKSILPSLVYYVGRIPLPITIILFSKQPLTQSICLLISSVFLLGVNWAIEYRRKIYKIMTLFTYFGLIVCASLIVVMCCGIDVSLAFDVCILAIFLILLLATVGQIVTNYEFFFSIFDYILARVCGVKRSD